METIQKLQTAAIIERNDTEYFKKLRNKKIRLENNPDMRNHFLN